MFTIGIDEAGRGPWAGPLVVAGVAVFDEKIFSQIPHLTDSKKISARQREQIFAELLDLEKSQKIFIATEIVLAQKIDEIGIREANRQAMQKIIFSLTKGKKEYKIFIDGADNFIFDDLGVEYIFAKKKNVKNQKFSLENVDFLGKNCIEFLIHGDALQANISAASIVAKVTRDSLMLAYAKDFPEYGFDSHKGYGTKKHHEAILNYGINFLHRKSYDPMKTLISADTGLL